MSKKKENLSLEERLQKVIIPKEEEPYIIPDNWIWTRLGEIGIWGSGGTPSRKNKNFYLNGSIPWLKTGDLNNGIVMETEEYITEEALKKSSAKIFKKDSIGIAMYGATIGKIGIFGKDMATNQACAVVKCFNEVENRFLFYFFKNAKEKLINKAKGGAQPNISQEILKNFLFPLPPLEEQKRIVEKLDSLFEKTQKIKDIIEEVKEKAISRREAILSKAFTGELAEKWRSENKTSSAEELLYKVNDEKIRVWEEECKKAEEEGKKKPSKPQIKDISEMLVKEDEIPYKVPDNWVWTRLGNIIDINMGQSPKGENVTQKFSENSFGLIGGPSDMGNNLPIISRYTTTPTKLSEEGEVILSIRATLGKTIFSDGKYCLGRGVCSLKSKIIDRNILRFYLTNITEYLYSIGTGSTFLQISKSDIENILFPLPPLEEQKEIVRILDKVFEEESKIDELLKLEESIAALESSILDKAFKGELGTQNKDDYPILERLKETL